MFKIRPVLEGNEFDQILRLTHDVYAAHGYCQPRPNRRLKHYPHLDDIPQTTVLVALDGEQIIGSNSLTLDGPRGLHVDRDFKVECDRIRLEQRRMAASWRIVTAPECRESRQVVMSLIQATVDLVIRSRVLTCVFTFNPRHERIYRRLLNMKTVGRCDHTAGLTNAPAVLMRWDLEDCPGRWLRTPETRAAQAAALARQGELVCA